MTKKSVVYYLDPERIAKRHKVVPVSTSCCCYNKIVLFTIDFFVHIIVCLFVYIFFFVCLLARLRENGWTDLHEIFREGVE